MEEETIIKDEENNKAEDNLNDGESIPRVEEETSIPEVKAKVKAKAKAKVKVQAEPEPIEPEYVAPKRRGRPKGKLK